MLHKKYVIIGASAAGIGALHRLKRLDPEASILVVSQEHEMPYNKCVLADYCAKTKTYQEILLPCVSYEGVTFGLGTSIEHINYAEKRVEGRNGFCASYEKLLLATGSSPLVPPFAKEGSLHNVVPFHTLADVEAILLLLARQGVKRATVIGAGLSGIECADVLARAGVAPTLVERNDRLLPHFLDSKSSQFLEARLQEEGVTILLGQTVKELQSRKGLVTEIVIASGMKLATDMVVIAAGVKPNVVLAVQAGIDVAQEGIVVDANLRTSAPDIYAAGDCIAVTDRATGRRMNSCTWPDAMAQGMHAAHAMAGQPKPYEGPIIAVSSSFFGLDFGYGGRMNPENENERIESAEGSSFHTSYLMQGDHLKGFRVLGKNHSFSDLKRRLIS